MGFPNSPGGLDWREDLVFFVQSSLEGADFDFTSESIENRIANIVSNLKKLKNEELEALKEDQFHKIDIEVKKRIFSLAMEKDDFSTRVQILVDANVFPYLLVINEEKPKTMAKLEKFCLRFDEEGKKLKLYMNTYLSQKLLRKIDGKFRSHVF